MTGVVKKYFEKNADAAALAVFRIFFGGIMLFGMIRFQYYDWIKLLYIDPRFHFKYLGFEWVTPFGEYTYGLFFICGLSAFLVMIGWKYRVAIITFFLSFTYIELMDKTNYLNHYYFVSCMAFLMCFLPANTAFSVDAFQKKISPIVPRWNIDTVRLMLSIVWFYAGLAKLNSDWMLEAQPLSIWLPSKYDVPILGDWLQRRPLHYLFSWAGAAYDLSIPFLLWFSRTRMLAFVAVVVFHVLTWILFPIGIFPWVMIGSALVFFDSSFFRKILGQRTPTISSAVPPSRFLTYKMTSVVVAVFFVLQLLIPFRHLLYEGELFWTEEGFRFSWRVMLMEKAGYANFKIVNPETGRKFYVQNSDFLTPLQEKQMATQPDFILQYAHYLERVHKKEDDEDLEVYVESYVALNGRYSQPYVDPEVDLTTIKYSLKPKKFLLPFHDEIIGF
ncbi:MAG: HTTM domain-containing protein [Bacteroidota bacterium]